MKLKWLQTPSCRSRRTARRNAAARSTRAACSNPLVVTSWRLPMARIIVTPCSVPPPNKKRRQRRLFHCGCCYSAMLLVVVDAGLVARVTTDRRAAERADGAATGHRRAERTARHRAAGRTDGLAFAHAGAGRQAEHTGHRTNRYQGLHHIHLLVKMADCRRLRCSRAAGRSRTGRESARPAPKAGCSPSPLPAGDATAETFPCVPPESRCV